MVCLIVQNEYISFIGIGYVESCEFFRVKVKKYPSDIGIAVFIEFFSTNDNVKKRCRYLKCEYDFSVIRG